MVDVVASLQEPIFLADSTWTEWRRYLGKPHRHILDAALEQFTASLQPHLDWMQHCWVRLCAVGTLGQGVRAVCDIPPGTVQGHAAAAVAADLGVICRA